MIYEKKKTHRIKGKRIRMSMCKKSGRQERRERRIANARKGNMKKDISCEYVPQTYSRRKVFF
jgi:hypothetical protein